MRASSNQSQKSTAMPIPRWEFVAMMASIFGLQAMGIDVMLPALEIIGDHYALEKANDQQWIIYAFVFGFGMPQLVFGPISGDGADDPNFFQQRAVLMHPSTYAPLLNLRDKIAESSSA